MIRSISISALFFLAAASSLQAADICEAIALRDVPSLDNPTFMLKRGDYQSGISLYRVDKKTGETSFCSHGGGCFLTHITENGKRIEALHSVLLEAAAVE